jgi:hypothetical protein
MGANSIGCESCGAYPDLRVPGETAALSDASRKIPLPDTFPILLAARMSLSFPILFAAVPLWAIDYEHPRAERDFERCMFFDGGISSNFLMHLFDGLILNSVLFRFNRVPKWIFYIGW